MERSRFRQNLRRGKPPQQGDGVAQRALQNEALGNGIDQPRFHAAALGYGRFQSFWAVRQRKAGIREQDPAVLRLGLYGERARLTLSPLRGMPRVDAALWRPRLFSYGAFCHAEKTDMDSGYDRPTNPFWLSGRYMLMAHLLSAFCSFEPDLSARAGLRKDGYRSVNIL